ncbi:MAG: hypothetical protein MZW92_65615 [Comamonadaceae bacterium]|nr:hypothetical protein [Comamonadaceae bacterium]
MPTSGIASSTPTRTCCAPRSSKSSAHRNCRGRRATRAGRGRGLGLWRGAADSPRQGGRCVIPNLLAGLTRDPAECVVKINDAPIEALYPLLAEVTVETGRNAPDTATLTFESRRDERGEWLVQDATGLFDDTPLMREWNRISIAGRLWRPGGRGAARLHPPDPRGISGRRRRRQAGGGVPGRVPPARPPAPSQVLGHGADPKLGHADPERNPGPVFGPLPRQDECHRPDAHRRPQPGRHRHPVAPGPRRGERLRALLPPRACVLRAAPRRPAPAPADPFGVCRQDRQLHLYQRHRRRPPARCRGLRPAGRIGRGIERSESSNPTCR